MESYLGQKKMKSALESDVSPVSGLIGASMAGSQVVKQSKEPAVAIQLEMLETNIGVLRHTIEDLAGRLHPVTGTLAEAEASKQSSDGKELMGSPLANYVYRLNFMVQGATADIRTITNALEI